MSTTNAIHTFGHAASADEPLIVDALTHLLRHAPEGKIRRAMYARREAAPRNASRHLLRAMARLRALDAAVLARGEARYSVAFANALRGGQLLVAADLMAVLLTQRSSETTELRQYANDLIVTLVCGDEMKSTLPTRMNICGKTKDLEAIVNLDQAHQESDFDVIDKWLARLCSDGLYKTSEDGFLANVAAVQQMLFDSFAGRKVPEREYDDQTIIPVTFAMALGSTLRQARLRPVLQPLHS